MTFPLAAVLVLWLPAAPLDGKKPVPKFAMSKATTYITEPLDKDGYLDYETALNERLRGQITPETNAMVLLWQAIGPKPDGREVHADYFQWLQIARLDDTKEYFIDSNSFFRKRGRKEFDEAFYDHFSLLSNQPWTAKNEPEYAAWLKANEKPLDMVLKATAFKEYFNPIVSRDEKGNHRLLVNAVLPNTQKIREIADALSKRAMLKLGEGKIDEAWTDLLVIHRLGRLVARGGTLIELMVGIAIDTVAHHGDLTFLEHTNLSSKQVMRHLKDLQDLPRMSNGTQIIDVAERLTLLDIVQSIRREGFGVLHEVSGNLRRPDKLTSEIEAAFSECDWSTLFRTSNRSFDELGTVMTSPDRATREKEMRKYLVSLRTDKVDANDGGNIADALKSVANTGGIANGKFGGNLVSIWMPAIAKITNTTDRFEQQQNCLLLAFALAAFRDENGKYPQSLEDLTPKYFAMITSDIFSGKPLVYRRKETGYLLYSVGANGRDDGGATFSDDPSADDIRVRVPLPKMKH